MPYCATRVAPYAPTPHRRPRPDRHRSGARQPPRVVSLASVVLLGGVGGNGTQSFGATADFTCNVGYTGNGGTCSDVNECTNGTSNCSANATCTNTAGSFTCACR